MNEADYQNMMDNVAKGKKKVIKLPEQNVNLFGEADNENIMLQYKAIFKAITATKDYIFIRGNVIGKKNKYINKVRFTGKSDCCNAIYDKKTRICTSCGKLTKSGKGSGGIGLNAEATKYLEDCVARLGKHYTKFNQHKFSDKFVLVGLFFIRPTDAGFDYDNMETMIGDALQKSTLIINDRAKMFMMIPMGYILDNVNPGVIISIIDHKKYFKFLISNYVS